MAQDGEVTRQEKMPSTIAKAVLTAIAAIESAEARSEADDDGRQFKYVGINDVLRVSHQALNDAKLHVEPIEIDCVREVINGRIWAHYRYRFRLIHESTTWVDEDNIHHVSHTIREDGLSSGKAQSLAWRNYVRGLLRIRVADAEEQSERDARDFAKEVPVRSAKPAAPKGSEPDDFSLKGIQFSFFYNKVETYTAQQAETMFGKYISPLRYAERKQWEGDEINATGLRQLHDREPIIWQHMRKALDAPDPKDLDDVSRETTPSQQEDTHPHRETRVRSPRGAAASRRPY